MATAPKTKQMREASQEVQQFIGLAILLIEAAGAYAAGGVYDADNDAMIRQIRVVTSGLNAALNSIPIMLQQPPVAAPTAAPHRAS